MRAGLYSGMESVSGAAAPGADLLHWMCMLTLFLASVVTIVLYLLQYFGFIGFKRKAESNEEQNKEAEELLSWLLGLRSWSSEWRRAWIRAVHQQQIPTQGEMQLIFEEDGVHSSELHLWHILSFSKVAGMKNVQCELVGDELQFSVSAAPSSFDTALKHRVKISPVLLQLALQIHEEGGEVQVTWRLNNLIPTDMQLTTNFTQGSPICVNEAKLRNRLQQVLCDARPSVILCSRTACTAELEEVRNRISHMTSPPKPPRAHQWKLLVKNIRIMYSQKDGAAGSVSPQCVLILDDPPQKLQTSVLSNRNPTVWDQTFIFELSSRSKQLTVQVLNNTEPSDSWLLGQVSVSFDLVRRNLQGQQTFTLRNADQVTGTLTTEISFLDPTEMRTWHPPTPVPAKRVEMDRTVMPCGTVVTTVTAIRSRPGRPFPPECVKSPGKNKLSKRRVSEQHCMPGAMVNKALSSSDTELLMLNGTDPVAEAAMRQLYDAAKQKLKSPVKKSTIIISGVTKTPLSQDEETALMAGYAASMDASMVENLEGAEHKTALPSEFCFSNSCDPMEGPSRAARDSETGKESDRASLSISEPSSKKEKGSFLHKGARLFFRRRQQRKEPGMSQSHNDLQYLAQAEEKRSATFKHLNLRKLHKHKSKTNGVQT